MLARIARQLLERERHNLTLSTKFDERLGERRKELFTPDEQCLRLLLDTVGLPEPAPPEAVPADLHNEYRDAVKGRMSEHPFRRDTRSFVHPVFMEYVYAKFVAGLPADQPELRREIHARLVRRTENAQKSEYLPSPLLASFALALAGDNQMKPTIGASDFGMVYESLLSERRREGSLWLVLDSAGGDQDVRGAFGFGHTKYGAEESFRISATGDGVWFWRRVRRAQVSVSCNIRLGVTGGSFALGPDVFLECEEFHCPVAELLIDAQSSDDPVVIVATSCDGTSLPALRGNVDGLYVSWPQPRYPWVRRVAPVLLEREDSQETMEAYKYSARIVTKLQSKGYGEVARHRDIIERFSTGGTALGADLLQFCRERKVVELQGPLYALGSGANTAGINWTDVRLRNLNENIREFIAQFFEWRRGRV